MAMMLLINKKKGGGAQCNAIIYYAILSLPYKYIKHSNQVFWVYRICIAVKINTCVCNNLHNFFSWTMTNIVHRNLINGNWCLKKKIRNEICFSWIVALKEKERSIFIRKYFCWTSNLETRCSLVLPAKKMFTIVKTDVTLSV